LTSINPITSTNYIHLCSLLKYAIKFIVFKIV